MKNEADGAGEIVVYTDPDGLVRWQVRLEDGSVWLSQAKMAELYGTTPQNITQHVRAIYDEGEQDPEATCKPVLQVRSEGSRRVSRAITHDDLAMICSARAQHGRYPRTLVARRRGDCVRRVGD